MIDNKTMSFELNQGQLDAAIAAALPGLISGLSIDYTSGRAPKGVTADVTLSEALIREAVIVHTRKLVNPSFTHFNVAFRATRGDDGLMALVTASADPIQAGDVVDAKEPATTAAPVAEAAPVEEAPVAATEPVAEAVETEAEAPVEAAEAPVEPTEVPVTEAVQDEAVEAEKPATQGRSRLFADLQRPNNTSDE